MKLTWKEEYEQKTNLICILPVPAFSMDLIKTTIKDLHKLSYGILPCSILYYSKEKIITAFL